MAQAVFGRAGLRRQPAKDCLQDSPSKLKGFIEVANNGVKYFLNLNSLMLLPDSQK